MAPVAPVGPVGPVAPVATGATGATGSAGPNQVTTSTATNLTGLLRGYGSVVSAVGVTAFVLTIFDDADAPAVRESHGAASLAGGGLFRLLLCG